MLATRPVLLLTVACASFCSAEHNTWKWNCDPVIPQQVVDLDKVIGRWYPVELIETSGEKEANYCLVVDIIRTRDTSRLVFQNHLELDHEPDVVYLYYTKSNDSVKLISSSHWIRDGVPQMVVDLPPDGESMTTVKCLYGELLTFVYGRNTTVDLMPIHARLLKMNVPGLWRARPFDRTGCSSVEDAELSLERERCVQSAGQDDPCHQEFGTSDTSGLCSWRALELCCLLAVLVLAHLT